MSMRIVEQVTEWDSVPFDGGYEGLRTLEGQEFSGAVVSGPAQLFMLNGRVVGILEGDIDDFGTGGGTARQAPHDALPLLAVMQDKTDGPRAQYYTEDTPMSEVDRTLTDGKFTGFVELSENVLSGDYYLVYHQGRSMSVAWVGSSQRLITDDEAFEQANDEVGIYEVLPAEIEPIEIPDPEPDSGVGGVAATETDPSPSEREPTTSTTGTATDTDDEFAEPALETDTSDSPGSVSSAGRDESTDRGSGTTPSGPPGSKAAGASQGQAVDSGQSTTTGRDTGTEPTAETRSADRSETTTDRAVEATDVDTGTESHERTEEPSGPSERAAEASEPATESVRQDRETTGDHGTADAGTSEPTNETPESTEPSTSDEVTAQSTASAESGSAASALETRSIPSLDPERSSSDTTSTPTPEPTSTGSQSTQSQSTQTEPTPEPEPTTDDQPTQSQQPTTSTTPDQRAGKAAELEAELDERESEIRQLESEIRDLSAENEELVAERNRLQSELEEARAEIRRLEEQLDTAEMPATGGVQLSATEAIDGTNLFVRYHSKGEATLKKAQKGDVDRSAVEENLRLEYHTQFDAEDAVVDGTEFQTFLRESIHYRFVDWLIRSLLYEIRDTGHTSAMANLYEALPEVDRAELNGQVSVVYTEDGQENRERQQFDVVVRDRMGNPIVVANINDSREPATDGMMTDIVQTAERVGNSSGSLAAAFLVTSSFFEPEALETAEEATSSGLFSRDKRKSFVNLSRKDGYHLCLLEARNNEFHLAVPEL